MINCDTTSSELPLMSKISFQTCVMPMKMPFNHLLGIILAKSTGQRLNHTKPYIWVFSIQWE